MFIRFFVQDSLYLVNVLPEFTNQNLYAMKKIYFQGKGKQFSKLSFLKGALSLTSIFLLSVFTSFGQEKSPETQKVNCRTTEAMQELYNTNPEAKKQAEAFETYTQEYVAKLQEDRKNGIAPMKKPGAAKYIIPTVVHVYGRTQNGESVSDLIVQTAIQWANEEFHGLNADFNTVHSQWLDKRGTIDIEFCLATKDENGNPTTGIIDHPVASGYGNGGSNLGGDSWDNFKYCNIYIMADLYGDGGTTNSGVAWYPDLGMSNAGTARVVYNGAYLSTNPTWNPEFAAVFTHELGHWLNLPHVFDGGCSTSNDGVADTPPTAGSQGCHSSSTSNDPLNCFGDLINAENYMDYNTNCYKMFTIGQMDRVDAALQHPARVTLWQQSNLNATGCQSEPEIPVADFSASVTEVCVGSSIDFTDLSTGIPDTWSWTFTGGTPSTSSSQTATVTYNTAGTYNVSLTASNSLGSDTKTVTAMITVGNTGVAPDIVEGFSGSFPPTGWAINNPDGGLAFEQRTDFGNPAGSMIMNNADNATTGEIDEITVQAIDLSTVSASEMSFDVAYTQFDANSPDVLRIYATNVCNPGPTDWTEVWMKTHTDLETAVVPTAESNDWTPTEGTSDWRNEVVDLSQFDGDSYVLVKFHNTSGYGTRIWIDNINIGRPLGVDDNSILNGSFSIYPNPSKGVYNVKFNTSEKDNYTLEVRNMIGQVVYNETLSNFTGEYRNSLDLSNLNTGVYTLTIKTNKGQEVRKLIRE